MRKVQEAVQPCRAAQYVRMSGNQQRYSIENQKDVIALYASAHGYEIVRTYTDAGKSGLSLKGRAGLRQLLADVLDPARDFDAVLVYDVTRWGRFQDTDEAAHYEFLCRQAKVKIVFCQEVFEDDASASASIMKLLKRVMAKEYSRELSERIGRAQRRLAALGYRMGGGSPYGFRRELRDERGKRRMLLETGERKATQTDRVVLVPGPPEEIAVINRIFDLYGNHGMTFVAIARMLAAEGVRSKGQMWTGARVRNVLRSELSIGTYLYNRTSKKLQGRTRTNPPDEWIRARVMAPTVPADLFAKVQARLAAVPPLQYSDDVLLQRLKALLKERGQLSVSIIDGSPLTPSSDVYRDHFGSMTKAFALVGYEQPGWVREGRKRRPSTEDEMIARLQELHARHGIVTEKMIDTDPVLPPAKSVRRHFGSTAAALEAAGLPILTLSEKILRTKYRGAPNPRLRPSRKRHVASVPAVAVTREEFLDELRRLLDEHGYLSEALIRADPVLPTPSTIFRAFGSLMQAYALAGWEGGKRQVMLAHYAKRRAALSATSVPPSGGA